VVNRLSTLTGRTCDMIRMLEEAVNRPTDNTLEAFANRCRDEILPRMEALRLCVDEMENWTGKDYWPYPSYGDLLFSVH
jgi:glutamine synthetase